jgi:hypothetical protein
VLPNLALPLKVLPLDCLLFKIVCHSNCLLFKFFVIPANAGICFSTHTANLPQNRVPIFSGEPEGGRTFRPLYEFKKRRALARAFVFYFPSHFRSRNCVINLCCSAASRISVAGSFSIRFSRIASISAADLPVAHTIKIRPKRFS